MEQTSNGRRSNQLPSEAQQPNKEGEGQQGVGAVEYDKIVDEMERRGLVFSKPENDFTPKDLIAAIKGDHNGGHIQSHGITQDEMKEIQRQQTTGDVKMVEGNCNSRFKLPAYEANLIHFSTERILFAEDGTKKSKPKMHIQTVANFERMSKDVKNKGDKHNPENAFAGQKVIIFHDPRKNASPTSKKSTKKDTGKSQDELLSEMNSIQLREAYKVAYGEDCLPTDTDAIVKSMIKDKWAQNEALYK